jgi:hypothetical protein
MMMHRHSLLQGMRIEIDFEGGKNAAGIYVHKKLPEAMGNSVAAFAHAVLSGHTQPGVWYPEEKEALAVSCWPPGASKGAVQQGWLLVRLLCGVLLWRHKACTLCWLCWGDS